MPTEVVRTIATVNEEHRVDFLKRDDGWFSFVEFERATNWDGDRVWTPVSAAPLPLCSSLEIAEREAGARIGWLAHMVKP